MLKYTIHNKRKGMTIVEKKDLTHIKDNTNNIKNTDNAAVSKSIDIG